MIFQLSADLNPSCPSDVCSNDEEDSKITLIHIKADGDNDTIHYIWDLSRQPSVLVALCERNTNVTFEWNNTFKDVSRINFKTKPKYTMSFVLTKVSSIQFVHYYRVFFQSLGPLSNWTFNTMFFYQYCVFFLKGFHFWRCQRSSMDKGGEWLAYWNNWHTKSYMGNDKIWKFNWWSRSSC